MKSGPLVPYMSIGDKEILHTILKDKDGNTYSHPVYIRIEEPDKIYGFKSTKINFDDMVIEERYGYSDKELSNIICFIDKNKDIIQQCAEQGGIRFAEII